MGELRLVCPRCGVAYRLDPGAIPPAGRDVECTACGRVWFQSGVAALAAEADRGGGDAPAGSRLDRIGRAVAAAADGDGGRARSAPLAFATAERESAGRGGAVPAGGADAPEGPGMPAAGPGSEPRSPREAVVPTATAPPGLSREEDVATDRQDAGPDRPTMAALNRPLPAPVIAILREEAARERALREAAARARAAALAAAPPAREERALPPAADDRSDGDRGGASAAARDDDLRAPRPDTPAGRALAAAWAPPDAAAPGAERDARRPAAPAAPMPAPAAPVMALADAKPEPLPADPLPADPLPATSDAARPHIHPRPGLPADDARPAELAAMVARTTPSAAAAAPGVAARPTLRRRAEGRGFALAVLMGALLLAAYASVPLLAARTELPPAVLAAHARVDAGRLWLHEGATALVDPWVARATVAWRDRAAP